MKAQSSYRCIVISLIAIHPVQFSKINFSKHFDCFMGGQVLEVHVIHRKLLCQNMCYQRALEFLFQLLFLDGFLGVSLQVLLVPFSSPLLHPKPKWLRLWSSATYKLDASIPMLYTWRTKVKPTSCVKGGRFIADQGSNCEGYDVTSMHRNPNRAGLPSPCRGRVAHVERFLSSHVPHTNSAMS